MAEAGRKIVVIGMGYVGIPAAALLADVPGHKVTGIQRRSKRSGWKIEWINSGKNPFEGDEPGMDLVGGLGAGLLGLAAVAALLGFAGHGGSSTGVG